MSLTIGLQTLYILVVMEVGSRRIIHTNVTAHPTAEWTAQQLRQAIPADHPYRFLPHDRDSIFSADCDASIQRLGLRVLKSPPRSPKANSFCERLIGTLRRECLDWIIPLSERQLRSVVREWAAHYNRGRPHMALGGQVSRIRPTDSRSRHAIRATTFRPARRSCHARSSADCITSTNSATRRAAGTR